MCRPSAAYRTLFILHTPKLEGLTPVLQMPKLQPIVAMCTLSPWQGLRWTLTGAVTTPSSVASVELGDTGREW